MGLRATLTALIAALIFSMMAVTADANPLLASNAENDEEQSTKSGYEVSELIEKLENPEQRKEFIRTLQELDAAEDKGDTSFSVKETFNVDKIVDDLVNDYRGTLRKFNVSESLLGAILIITAAICFLVVLVYANTKLSYVLDKRVDRVRKTYKLNSKRFKIYFQLQRFSGYVLGVLLSLFSIIEFSTLSDSMKDRLDVISLTQLYSTLALVLLVFITIWEAVNTFVELLTNSNSALQGSRAKTLIPLARNFLMFILFLLSGIVVLSEFGVDVVPLMAGAGVFGIAIGFGAQKMVKDLITGFTVILEDLIQIGDVVRLSDRTGVVERITIRKVQMRSLGGTVYTIPFGDVGVVENLTKDFSYYLMDVGVAYREDVAEVYDCLNEVDEGLRKSEEFSDSILEPLEILGLDRFADSAIIVRARIKTIPKQQWSVGREFNRRLKCLFDEKSIEMPFPHQTIYFGEDKNGKAPNANLKLMNELSDSPERDNSKASSIDK